MSVAENHGTSDAEDNTSADMIMFGEDWGGHPTSTQHLARRFARNRKVVYINSVGMRRPRINPTDIARIGQKIGQRFGERSQAQTPRVSTPDNISVVSPLVVPWPGSSTAERINRTLLTRRITERCKTVGMNKPLLWLTLPTALPVVGHLNEQAVIYYVPDDFSALDGVDHKQVVDIEKRLVEKADLIITVSEELHSHFPDDKTVMIPHGVDTKKFASPVPRAADLPTDRKIAGFYGAFLDRIDTQILRRAALNLPDWLFFFIGPIGEEESSNLRNLPNTMFVGPRPHNQLASYLQHWDVSLLPFADCAMVRSMNPLKLREYLAAGTPVATVDFPALAPYKHLVSLAEPRNTLSEAILRANQDTGRNEERRNAMTSETWEARADQISAELARL